MPDPLPAQSPFGDQSYEAVVLRTLNTFAVDVMSIPNVSDLLWYVAQNVVGKLNFVDCVIYTADAEEKELTQVAALGEKNPHGRDILNPLRIPFGQGITGRVAQTGTPIVVDDLLRENAYIADTQPARSEICVPLVYGNRVVGVIDSEHPEPGAFGPAELDVLSTVAAMTSAKLELLAEADRSEARYRDLMAAHTQLTQETNNRKSLETKLFEARRLDAIGRLSGGFAHDFNNILTVVSGNLELLEAVCPIDDPAATESIQAARAAAARGAELIQGMLAFSQRARLTPEAVHLGDVVQSTLGWCRKALPPEVEVAVLQGDDLWPARADKLAAGNALLNLLLNARDAMPSGGRVRIVTENVTVTPAECGIEGQSMLPGKYVRLSVIDTGRGIPQNRLQQVFDPFYTTKPVGLGSGLGLSTVHGFMQQSGGTVQIDSRLGRGTSVHLFFPAEVGKN